MELIKKLKYIFSILLIKVHVKEIINTFEEKIQLTKFKNRLKECRNGYQFHLDLNSNDWIIQKKNKFIKIKRSKILFSNNRPTPFLKISFSDFNNVGYFQMNDFYRYFLIFLYFLILFFFVLIFVKSTNRNILYFAGLLPLFFYYFLDLTIFIHEYSLIKISINGILLLDNNVELNED